MDVHKNMGLQKFGVIIIRLILGLWRNITQRNGGYGGVLKHTDGSSQRHSQCIEQRRLFAVLLAIYIQSVYPKKLLGICTLLLRHSLCHQHLHNMAFSSVPSVSPCALLYKCFNISLNILEEQKNPNRDSLYE